MESEKREEREERLKGLGEGGREESRMLCIVLNIQHNVTLSHFLS